MEKQVKIQLVDIYCRKTQDKGFWGLLSKDEPTVLWDGLVGRKKVRGSISMDGIDDGERLYFKTHNQTIYDGLQPKDNKIFLIISLFERDQGGNRINSYRQATDNAIRILRESMKVVDEIPGGIIFSGPGKALADAIEESGIPKMIQDMAGYLDDDDFLGNVLIEDSISSLSSKEEIRTFSFRESDASYKVRLRIKIS